MEKTSVLVNKISNDTQDYIKLQALSIKLEIYERVTNLITSGINAGIITIFGLLCALFINVGIAFWLSEVTGSYKFGFLLVGGLYFLILGLYILLKDKSTKEVKNSILLQVSKTHDDFEILLKEQETVSIKVEKAEQLIKESAEELKANLQTIKDDFKKLKSNFVSEEKEIGEEKIGAPLPRLALTSIVDLLLNKVVLKNSGLLKKAILPIVTKALLTSTVFKENKTTSFIENLKLKLPKILR